MASRGDDGRAFYKTREGHSPNSANAARTFRGEWCTGPIAWNATSEEISTAVSAIGVQVVSHSGGPLPEQVDLEISGGDLSADEANSLSGDAYFGGAGIAVVVSQLS